MKNSSDRNHPRPSKHLKNHGSQTGRGLVGRVGGTHRGLGFAGLRRPTRPCVAWRAQAVLIAVLRGGGVLRSGGRSGHGASRLAGREGCAAQTNAPEIMGARISKIKSCKKDFRLYLPEAAHARLHAYGPCTRSSAPWRM